VALAELQLVATPLAAAVYAGTLGSAVGLQSTVGGVLWAHEYGRHGLGRVQGAAGMIQITGSAVGPLLLAALAQQTATHTLSLMVLAAIPLGCLAIMAHLRRQPRPARLA
jgi:nitrate/nitrite transporter NarK